MSKIIGVLSLFFLFLAATSAVSAFSSPQDETVQQVEQLKKQVAALEQRVKDLEGRLEKLTIAIPQTFPNLMQLPKGWEKREFNGLSYYMIPLNQNSAQTKPVIR